MANQHIDVVLDGEGNSPRYSTAPNIEGIFMKRKGNTGKTIGSIALESDQQNDLELNKSFLIAAVSENRAREIGIAAIDLTAPYELLLWSVIDSHSYSESISILQAYQPIEIVVVDTNKPRSLSNELSKRFSCSACRVVPIARKYFDQTKGAEDLKHVMLNPVDINLSRNYVAMAAVASLMKYIEFIQGVHIAEKTMNVVINPSTQKLLMDQATIISLELVKSLRGNSTKKSLCGIIDNTQTAAGSRLLRTTMLQPTRHLKTISSRHEVIGIFLDNPGRFFDTLEQLPHFKELDRLLGQLVIIPKVITPRATRLAIGSIIALSHALKCLPQLTACLDNTQIELEKPSRLLDSISKSLRHENLDNIRLEISKVINEKVNNTRNTAQKRIQECFAVRAGIDGMLDVARRTYLDTIEKIYKTFHGYKDSLGVPVRLSYTARRGYYLLVPANIKDLPSSLIECSTARNGTQCSTQDLNTLNARLREALTAVYKLSNKVIQQLLDKVRPQASTLYTLVESIAVLDMLLSFTNVVALAPASQPYVRPNMMEKGNLLIQKVRHPLVESAMKDQTYIPNDCFFDPINTFHVITGPNCSGKSTYMRSLAITIILAQMGCYVPAAEAFIPLRDRICTRFGTSDDMEENASTFAVEMKEAASVLEVCTQKSVVLIDELGRGTANDEGAALAWSISEDLINRRVYTCFATHYHELNELAEMYGNCRSYHMNAIAGENLIRYQYKLKDGPMPMIEMYGIKSAKLCGIPSEIITEAERIYKQLSADNDEKQQTLCSKASIRSANSHKRLIHNLLSLRHADLSSSALRQQLIFLQQKFKLPTAPTDQVENHSDISDH